jgi:hypothetical protein
VEATGVELFSVLTTRKLLILGTARTAKKASLPNPLYVYCTKMLLALKFPDTTWRPQYPIHSPRWIEKKRQRLPGGPLHTAPNAPVVNLLGSEFVMIRSSS